jgi:DNA transformation protein
MTSLAPWLEEALGPLGTVRVRAMFGGHGVSLDGLSIGLVADDVLYLKCDAQTLARFEAEGLGPFLHEKDGRMVAMSYRRAPDAAMDDGDVLREWAGLALEAARRAKRSAPRRAPRGLARGW